MATPTATAPTKRADPEKATPTEIREFFGTPTVTLPELKALKEDKNGNKLQDYDEIAYGIGRGTLTY
jgi:hypothetical protein